MKDFVFVEHEKLGKLSNFTLLEGFPGMGLVGTIAAKYIIDALKMTEVGHIEGNAFMPVVRIHEGLPIYPARIYIDKKRKILVLISEQIIPNELAQSLADSIIKWLQEKKINKVISLAGIKTNEPGKNVYGIASGINGIQELKKNKIPIIKEGITTGITAMILVKLKKIKEIKAYALLADVKFSADYESSSQLVKKVNEILNLNIDTKPLEKEAKKTEETLIENLKRLKETHEKLSEFENRAPMTA